MNLDEIIVRATQICVGRGQNPMDSPLLDAGLCSVDICDRQAVAHGLCGRHYQHVKRRGHIGLDSKFGTGDTFAERFWSRVALTADPEKCWEWRGHISGKYGQVGYQRKRWRVHRMAWLLVVGTEPPSLLRHRCDNPPCCNPAHLVPGDHLANAQDRVERGRGSVGSHRPQAKLNESTVKQMLLLMRGGQSIGATARQFNINRSVASRILSRKTWAHVEV